MRKINISIIGYGYWGPKLARNFNNSNYFKVISVVETLKKNQIKAKKDFPLAQILKNYKDIFKQKKINLVVISSPTKTHYKIAKFALENKTHVLVEKPISTSLSEVKILENIARKNNLKLFVDYPFLFSGSINYVKKLIDKKKYGSLISIESFREKAPIRNDCNVIWDLTVHDISILIYLIKKIPQSFKSTKIKTIKHNLDDTAYITLTYSNKLNVFLKNSWISPEKIRLIKFKFQRAIIYCDENEPMYKIKIFISKNKDNTDFNLKIPEINLNEPLSILVDYVYKSIKNNNNPIFENKLNIKITKILKNLSK